MGARTRLLHPHELLPRPLAPPAPAPVVFQMPQMGQRIGGSVAIVRLPQRVREGIVRRQVRAIQRIDARGVAQRRERRFVVGRRGHRFEAVEAQPGAYCRSARRNGPRS